MIGFMKMDSSKSTKAQNLLGQLRSIVEEQEKTITQQQTQITNLKLEVQQLSKTNEDLLKRIKMLEGFVPDNTNGKMRHKRRSSSGKHTRTLSDHQTEMKAVDGHLPASLLSTVERSGSFHRNHLEEQDVRLRQSNDYELSSDIRDKQLEVLRKQYGGAEKCEHAARIIQEAYRNYQMKIKFDKIRKSKVRRLTIDNVIAPTSPERFSNESQEPRSSTTDNEDADLDTEYSYQEPVVTAFAKSHNEQCKDYKHTNGDIKFSMIDTSTVIKETKLTAVAIDENGAENDEERMKEILVEAPISNNHKFTRRKKKHGYETVVLGGPLPPTPEHDSISSSSLTLQSLPPNNPLPQSRNSDGETASSGRRLSPAWQRSNSEISLSSYDNEHDKESLRSSDTGSINSEMFAIGDSVPTVYSRRSSVRDNSGSDTPTDMERKRYYRIGLNLFNLKPAKGISFLIEHQFIEESASSVAKFLFKRNGLSRQMVSEYLGNTQKIFNQKVLESVCELMDFSGLEVDEALRMFQAEIRVQGEAQKVERLVEAFSQRFCTCNPKMVERLLTPDSIFVLAFAIIMLNTDLHSPNMKHEKRMTEQDFIKNLRGVDKGEDLDETLLKNIYNRIKERELITKEDHLTLVLKVENSIVGKKPVLSVPQRRLISRCRLFQVLDITKPQKLGVHQREVFLFNDTILITKLLHRKKHCTTYTFKQSVSLHGLGCYLFDCAFYPHGIRLHNTIDNKAIMTFNAPNENDKKKFVNDVKECIAEVQLMETLRIGAELERAHSNLPMDSRSNKLSIESKKFSTSMQNLNDSRLVSVPVNHNARPMSMHSLSVMTGGNKNNNNRSPSPGRTSRSSDGSTARNGSRLPVFGTFFAAPNKRNTQRRSSKTFGDSIPYAASNGDSPGVTLTFHKVHEV